MFEKFDFKDTDVALTGKFVPLKSYISPGF